MVVHRCFRCKKPIQRHLEECMDCIIKRVKQETTAEKIIKKII